MRIGDVDQLTRKLRELASSIVTLGSRVTTNEADIAALETAIVPFEVVRGYAQNLSTSQTSILTTETVNETITLSIPADWNSYDIEAEASCLVLETGTLTATRNVNLRIRMDDATGTEIGLNVEAIAPGSAPDDRNTMVVLAFVTGETSVDTDVDVVFTSEIAADSGEAAFLRLTFRARAIRVS